MKRTIIVSGGSLNEEFALDFLKKTEWNYLIGADKGICFLKKAGICPTHIVGDFDSAAREDLEYFREKEEIEIREYKPEKDLTDTEIALRLALSLDGGEITILGGTGKRMDHFVSNLKNLDIALQQGRDCILLDEHNRIRLIDKPLTLKKEEQFGKYVSLFAYGGRAEGITLEGFYYLLTNYDMEFSDAVGVSNEITEKTASIVFKKGKILVMESRD